MQPLEGITVVDLSISVSGPMAAAMLADAGARVIKIERVTGELTSEWDSVVHGMSSSYVWNARNKESVALDLKDARALDAVHRLIERADVVIENFSPGTAERIGVGYAQLSAKNPRLIYCHISGYGQEGPYRGERAFDFLVQGECGLIAMNGTPEEACKVPLSIADISAAMYAAQAVTLALIARERTGVGDEIDIAMQHSLLSWMGYHAYFAWFRDQNPQRIGSRHHLLVPYGPFSCSDGSSMNVAVLSQAAWRTFCERALQQPELAADPRFATNELRVRNRDALDAIVAATFRMHPRAYWDELLHALGLPCGQVLELKEALKHPQVLARGVVQQAPSRRGVVPAISSPVRAARMEMRYDGVPVTGEHTRGVLSEIGLSADEIDAMLRDGACREADAGSR